MYRWRWHSTCIWKYSDLSQKEIYYLVMIQDTAMTVNLIFYIFFNRGGNFNKDYDRKMVTKVWLDSVGVAFISVFCRNIVHFLKGLI